MKGIYCALFLVCCTLSLCNEVRAFALADKSESNTRNAGTPDWVPQPSDIGLIEERRLLAVVKAAQKTLVETPKDATAWGQLGNIYFVHGWEVAAAECYRSAVGITSNEFRWLYYLGMTTYKVNPQVAAQMLAAAILGSYTGELETLMQRFATAKKRLRLLLKILSFIKI